MKLTVNLQAEKHLSSLKKKIEEYDIEITDFSQYICSVVSKIN